MTAPLLDPQDRAFLFDWLATVFLREPDAATIALLRGAEGKASLAAVGAVPGLRGDAVALGRALDAIHDREGNDSDTALALAARFGTLFLGAGGSDSAHPYASVYLEKRTHGAATDRVAAFLAAHDLGVDTGIPEPADHIAVALAALAELSRREVTAAAGAEEALLKAQKGFVAAELIPWVGSFCERVEDQDPDGYYAAAARITRTVLTTAYGSGPR